MAVASNINEGALDWAVVIPSNRSITPAFLEGIPEEVPIYVVDDSNGHVQSVRSRMMIFTYADYERLLGHQAHLVPRRSAACRNFAYYYIARETSHTHIVTLDDDCSTHADFLAGHSVVGRASTWPTVSSPTGWTNSIDLLPVPQPLYARGYPYWLRGDGVPQQTSESSARSVCNVGLWKHHLDFDGMDKYVVDRYQTTFDFDAEQVMHRRIGLPEQPTLVPFSGMNVAFSRDLLSVMTQVPMNQQLGHDYYLWRFDDLWCGVIAQALINRRPEDCLTCGAPVVTHTRAGNLQREVAGEHYGHLLAPYFHDLVGEAATEIDHDTYPAMYVALCTAAAERATKALERGALPRLYGRTLQAIFRHLRDWGALFV